MKVHEILGESASYQAVELVKISDRSNNRSALYEVESSGTFFYGGPCICSNCIHICMF